MKKVSFDFDSTLDRKDVQEVAQQLIKDGFEVWIVTSRMSDEEALKFYKALDWNSDLFSVADSLGVSRDCIFFTCGEMKADFLKDKGFLFHLDDDSIEIDFINSETSVKGISCWKNNSWQKKINQILAQEN